MINVENFKLLRDELVKSQTYDQSDYTDRCGAPACLAGHAAFLSLQPNETVVDQEIQDHEGFVCTLDVRATEWLGVLEASNLFASSPAGYWPERYQNHWAGTYDLLGRNRQEAQKVIALNYLDSIIATGSLE